MKAKSFLPSLLIPLLLAGCAAVSSRDREVLRAHDVPPALYDKMTYGDPLEPGDVIALSRRGVPAGLIIRYVEDNNHGYRYTREDVRRMRAAGVSELVISHLLSISHIYVGYGYGPYPYYGHYGPYGYYDPYYYPGPVIYTGIGYGWGWHGHHDDWHEHDGGWHDHGGGGHHHDH